MRNSLNKLLLVWLAVSVLSASAALRPPLLRNYFTTNRVPTTFTGTHAGDGSALTNLNVPGLGETLTNVALGPASNGVPLTFNAASGKWTNAVGDVARLADLTNAVAGRIASANGIGTNLTLHTSGTGAALAVDTSALVVSNGQVAIGRSTPQWNLHVAGTNAADYFVGNGSLLTGLPAASGTNLIFTNITALRSNAVAYSVDQPAWVSGYYTNADGGGGWFYRSAVSSADNGGTILVDGAGQRWLRSVHSTINAKWFGARGDNATDDTLSLQAGLNALPSAGGTFYLPAGTYLTTNELLLSRTNSVTILGDGHHASVLSPQTPTQNVIHVQMFQGVYFANFGIYTAVTMTNGAGIYVEGPTGVAENPNIESRFDNLWLCNLYDGIAFLEAAEWTISSCWIMQTRHVAVDVRNTINNDWGDSAIVASHFQHYDPASLYGIWLRGSGGLKVSATKIQGFRVGIFAPAAYALSGILVVTGCSIENQGIYGIEMFGSSTNIWLETVITGNQFYNASNSAIFLKNTNVIGTVISGNLILISAGKYGIAIEDAKQSLITGNILWAKEGSTMGVGLTGNASGICRDNLFSDFGGGDTKIYNVSSNVVVHLNGTAAPTGDTWRPGDTVWNTVPTEAGSAGSKYVIQGWTYNVAGNPGNWLQMRCLTGN